MRTSFLALAAVLAVGAATACTSDNAGTDAVPGNPQRNKIGVILPDTKSSQRWRTDDPKYLAQAFQAAGIVADIQNAEGDRTRFIRIADAMIADGVKVLMIVNLDSSSGKVVLDKAKAHGVKTVDYDRLTLNGGADFFVSFDNRQIGVLQGEALVRCLARKGVVNPVVAELNGSPTDANALAFKEGYDSVLQPLYDSSYTKGPDQWVPDWDTTEAGVIFEEMLQAQPGITGVIAANDGVAQAAINVLRKYRRGGKVPVTGQDATVQGLQNILAGYQCMTVYKEMKREAQAAAQVAIGLFNGRPPRGVTITKVKDDQSGAYLPAVLVGAKLVTRSTVGDVIGEGFVGRNAVCTPEFERLCTRNGI